MTDAPATTASTTQAVSEIPGLLTGRVAVVTGGAQGLGLAMARSLVNSGARSSLGDMNEESLQAAVAELGGAESAAGVVCNVASLDNVEKLAEAATQTFGGVDILVNNAGITRDATIRKMTEKEFDDVIAVHLRGTWNGLKVAIGLIANRRAAARSSTCRRSAARSECSASRTTRQRRPASSA